MVSTLILCGLNRVSCVITDTGASDAAVQMLEQSGVKVLAVAPEALAEAASPLSAAERAWQEQ